MVQEYICTDTWMDDTTSSSMWPVTTADSCGGDFWAVQSTAKGGVNGYIPLEVPHIAPLLTLRSRKGIFHKKEKFRLETRCFCLDCWQFGRIWSFWDHWRNLLMLEAFKRLFGAKRRCFGLQGTLLMSANMLDFNGTFWKFWSNLAINCKFDLVVVNVNVFSNPGMFSKSAT